MADRQAEALAYSNRRCAALRWSSRREPPWRSSILRYAYWLGQVKKTHEVLIHGTVELHRTDGPPLGAEVVNLTDHRRRKGFLKGPSKMRVGAVFSQ